MSDSDSQPEAQAVFSQRQIKLIWSLPKSSLKVMIHDINCNVCNEDQILIGKSMPLYDIQLAIQRWNGNVIIPEPLRTHLWTLYVPAAKSSTAAALASSTAEVQFESEIELINDGAASVVTVAAADIPGRYDFIYLE